MSRFISFRVIKNIWSDHPLLGIASMLYALALIFERALELWYKDPDNIPDFFIVAGIILMLSCFVCMGIGAVLFLSKPKDGSRGLRARFKTFFTQGWYAAKVPILLAMLLFLGILLWALVTDSIAW